MAIFRHKAASPPVAVVDHEPQYIGSETAAELFQRQFVDRNAHDFSELNRYGSKIDDTLGTYLDEHSEIPDFVYSASPNGTIKTPISEFERQSERREVRTYLRTVNEQGPLIALWSMQLGVEEYAPGGKTLKFGLKAMRAGLRYTQSLGFAVSDSAPQKNSLVDLQARLRMDISGQQVRRLDFETDLHELLTSQPQVLGGIVDWLEKNDTQDDGEDSPVREGVLELLAGSYASGYESQGAIKEAVNRLKADARPFLGGPDAIAELLNGEVANPNIASWMNLMTKLASPQQIAEVIMNTPVEELPNDIQRVLKTAGQQLAEDIDTALAAHLKPYYHAHRYRYPPPPEQFWKLIERFAAASAVFKEANKSSDRRVGRIGSIVLPTELAGAERSLQQRVSKKVVEKPDKTPEKIEEKPVFLLRRLGTRTCEISTEPATEEEITELLHNALARYRSEAAEKDMRRLLHAICTEPARASKYNIIDLNVNGAKLKLWGAQVGNYPNLATTTALSRDIRIYFTPGEHGIYFLTAAHKDDQKEIVRKYR